MKNVTWLDPGQFFRIFATRRKLLIRRLRLCNVLIVSASGRDYAGSIEASTSIRSVLDRYCKSVATVGGVSALLKYLLRKRPDLIINLEYGALGDSGVITAISEGMNIPVTGNSFLPIALMWNKEYTKRVLLSANIVTPRFISCSCDQWRQAVTEIRKRELNWPLIVKPLESSVSNGISIIDENRELEVAFRSASKFSQAVLVEEYIEGQELSVGVFGTGAEATVLPIVEIVVYSGAFQSRDVKFTKGKKANLIPARLADEGTLKCKRIAHECHRLLGADCISRMDCIYSRGRFHVLEVNGNPGFLVGSLFPKETKAVGIDYETTILSWVYLSFQRYDNHHS